MDSDVKQTLAAITEHLIKATETAYRAEQRANGAFAFISGRHPQAHQEFEVFVQNNPQLAAQRDAQVQELKDLLAKLK